MRFEIPSPMACLFRGSFNPFDLGLMGDAKDEGGDLTNRLESHPDPPVTPPRPNLATRQFNNSGSSRIKLNASVAALAAEVKADIENEFIPWKVKLNVVILLFCYSVVRAGYPVKRVSEREEGRQM